MTIANDASIGQSPFALALLDPSQDALEWLSSAHPLGARRQRFDVHRNTVVSSLIRALGEGFPSIERLLGARYFAALAAEYVRKHPPQHPVMLAYGVSFPAFLATFPPLANLPYLADVARLDGLRRRAWHAADAKALRPEDLSSIPPERLARRRIGLHPSVAIMASPFPARSLWEAQHHEAPTGHIEWVAETSAIWRDGERIRVEALDSNGQHLFDRARRGIALSELLTTQTPDHAEAIAAAFGAALAGGLLIDVDAQAQAHETIGRDALFEDFLPPFPTSSSSEHRS